MNDEEIIDKAVRKATELCVVGDAREKFRDKVLKELKKDLNKMGIEVEKSALTDLWKKTDGIFDRLNCETKWDKEKGQFIIKTCPPKFLKTAEARSPTEPIEAIDSQLADRDRQISELRSKLDSLESRLANFESQLAERDLRTFDFLNRLASLDSRLSSLEEG